MSESWDGSQGGGMIGREITVAGLSVNGIDRGVCGQGLEFPVCRKL